VVTRLPFHATEHGCRQALPDREGEPELFGVTRRQALGRRRLDGRHCRIDRFGDSYRFGRDTGLVAVFTGIAVVVTEAYPGVGQLGERRGWHP
jgi:hypothetical protein